MKSQLRKILIILMSLVLMGLSVFVVFITGQRNFEPTQSDALYGGEDEPGYPSAGFLVAYEDATIKTCGYSVIGPNTAVTAAHCVDNSRLIYMGQGQFNFNHSVQTQVLTAQQKEGWVNQSLREDDFAILNFIGAGNFTEFAQVASPTKGCNYRVVAYGRTEDPSENNTKPRKSAILCADEIFDKVMYMSGRDSGICFGDSGSPVYYNGTNALVGVVASIIREPGSSSSDDPCAFGNTAIIVRIDNNKPLIDQVAQDFDPTAPELQINEALAIQVAAEDNGVNTIDLSVDGLQNYIRNADNNFVFILVTVAFFVLLFLLFLVVQQEREISKMKRQNGVY